MGDQPGAQPGLQTSVDELTDEIRLLRTDLRGLGNDLKPVVAAVQAAGGVQGLMAIAQKYGPTLEGLARLVGGKRG